MLKGFTRSSISPQLCSLYFKGLVGEDSLAGFGVAICGHRDDLLFQLNGPIHGSDITVLEAELMALKKGLTEAAGLGIDHISIYCDYYPVYELISFAGRFVTEENKIALLINDVQRIRERFLSSFPIFVAGNSIRYAYKLARAKIVSEISISVDPPRHAAKQRTCPICFDDDLEAEEIYYVSKCSHIFCSECMKRHLEVRLLEGSVPRCPDYGCKSNLTLGSCAHLLTPKLRDMWERKIKEDSIPVWDRVYCPKPRCSALMSKTELFKWTGEAEGRRCCIKCGEPLCINCKVPWHNNLSCNDYKRLHPNPTENDGKLKALANQKMWRQCGNCQHMTERSEGCIKLTCRCGYSFCYMCGAEWKQGGCPHRAMMNSEYTILVLAIVLIIFLFWFV